jgi:hypothetical protein
MGVQKFKHAQTLPSNLILASPKSKKVTQLLRIAVQTCLFALADYSGQPESRNPAHAVTLKPWSYAIKKWTELNLK